MTPMSVRLDGELGIGTGQSAVLVFHFCLDAGLAVSEFNFYCFITHTSALYNWTLSVCVYVGAICGRCSLQARLCPS